MKLLKHHLDSGCAISHSVCLFVLFPSGGDQGVLNSFFSDWATADISKHLPFIYNLSSISIYTYLPAFKQWVRINMLDFTTISLWKLLFLAYGPCFWSVVFICLSFCMNVFDRFSCICYEFVVLCEGCQGQVKAQSHSNIVTRWIQHQKSFLFLALHINFL